MTVQKAIKMFLQLFKPLIEKFPKLSMLYRSIRDSRDISKAPSMTELGFKFNGNRLMQNGIFEPEETKIVKHILNSVDLVINVGANIGYYSCLALHAGKNVIAFEPMQMNINFLLRNVKANNWEKNIEIFPIALSDKVGIIDIYGTGTGASLIPGWAGVSDEYHTLIPCSTLDNVIATRNFNEKILFIVDIEGAEKMFLDGACKFLTKELDITWLVEISVKEHQPIGVTMNPNLLDTFDIFWNLGYVAITADNRQRQIKREELVEIIDSGIDTLETHNFLFLRK